MDTEEKIKRLSWRYFWVQLGLIFLMIISMFIIKFIFGTVEAVHIFTMVGVYLFVYWWTTKSTGKKAKQIRESEKSATE